MGEFGLLRLRKISTLAAVCAATVLAVGMEGPSATAAQPTPVPPPSTAQTQPAATAHGCPSGVKLNVPSAAGVAEYGASALLPASMPQARRTADRSPALQKIAHSKVQWLTSLNCSATALTNGPRPAQSRSARSADTPQQICTLPNTNCQPNWSGYQTGTPRGTGTYSDASMEWDVPDASHSGDRNAHVTIWPGIGVGSNDDKLVQAGTESVQYSFLGGLFHTQRYYAWIEIVPGEYEIPISNLPVHPGDHMLVDVSYDTTTHNATFTMYNMSTGKGGSISQPVKGSTGSQSEWIVERTCQGPQNNCKYTPLVKYGNEKITNAGGQLTDGGTTSGFFAGQMQPQNTPMTDCKETKFLSTVGPLDSTGGDFTTTWQDYGKSEKCH